MPVLPAVLGCNLTAGLVPSPRTPIEQLLLTQALFRSLDQISLPIMSGESLSIELAGVPSHDDFNGDIAFSQAVLTSWFARKGATIGDVGTSTHRVRVLLHAFGVDKKDTFIGIPPVQSLVLPVALPELTLYQNSHRRGYARVSIDVFDAGGRLISAPPPVEATVQHRRYTLLFLLSWDSTDLIPPPL